MRYNLSKILNTPQVDVIRCYMFVLTNYVSQNVFGKKMSFQSIHTKMIVKDVLNFFRETKKKKIQLERVFFFFQVGYIFLLLKG